VQSGFQVVCFAEVRTVEVVMPDPLDTIEGYYKEPGIPEHDCYFGE
jgi:hypothetical protein